MSKLSTLIRTVEIFKGRKEDINLRLPWNKKDILTRLDRCTDVDIIDWHQHYYSWIIEQQYPPLESLCTDVAQCLLSATTKIKQWMSQLDDTKGKGRPSSSSKLPNRMFLAWTLLDVEKALKVFKRVYYDSNLHLCDLRLMVLIYLRKTYELMLLLGQMLYSTGDEACFLSEAWIFIQETNLQDFCFDGKEDYDRVADPTLAGVIVDVRAVPEHYLSRHAGPPIWYLNRGPYGPAVMRNYIPRSSMCRSRS